jgi:hypothetical protein
LSVGIRARSVIDKAGMWCDVQDSPPEPSNNKVYIEHSDEFEAYVATYGVLSATQPAKWQFGLCN